MSRLDVMSQRIDVLVKTVEALNLSVTQLSRRIEQTQQPATSNRWNELSGKKAKKLLKEIG
jgi:hypothetical protein